MLDTRRLSYETNIDKKGDKSWNNSMETQVCNSQITPLMTVVSGNITPMKPAVALDPNWLKTNVAMKINSDPVSQFDSH